jgi:hypothetical protein
MADTVRIETGEGSRENVAYKLLLLISGREEIKDKKAILDTYAECLEATMGSREFGQSKRGF